MITDTTLSTIEFGNYFAILPSTSNYSEEDYIRHYNAKKVALGFKYNSGTNDNWETVESLIEKIGSKYSD